MSRVASSSVRRSGDRSRILVSGSDGFVGGHLVPGLRAALGEESIVFTCTREPVAGTDNEVRFDLQQPESIRAAVAEVRPDVIVHLAALASVGQSSEAAAQTWSVNMAGSMALAEAIAAHAPASTVLFASSAEVYGATFNDGIASEGSALRPTSPYGRSKAAAEAMFADVLPATCSLIVTRAANHSGSGQSASFVLPGFAGQVAAGECRGGGTIRVGNLDSRRDFLAVEDVVRAYLLLLARSAALPSRSVFNIASGHSYRIGDLLHRLLDLTPAKFTIERDLERTRPNEIAEARLENGALTALGWAPQRSIDDMIAAILDDQRRRLQHWAG